jgi:hypothetical protein
MGYWGVRSYEIDQADEALDAGMERVHGAEYEQLMDDRNPLSYEQVQQKLASPSTLAASLALLQTALGIDTDDAYDEEGRLAYVGVVVRHAECRVPLPEDVRRRAIAWLKAEDLDWDQDQARRDRRIAQEIASLESAATGSDVPAAPGSAGARS